MPSLGRALLSDSLRTKIQEHGVMDSKVDLYNGRFDSLTSEGASFGAGID